MPVALTGDLIAIPKRLLAGALLMSSAGCAAIDGNQRPVTAGDLEIGFVCPSRAQLDNSPTDGKGPYRDAVVMQCVKAINTHYLTFRKDLHRSAVGANLATDIVSLGLTTGASIASGATAKRLAAGGAFVIGAGTAINKDVFYQQTLPAIEASMDANRDRVLTRIVDAEKGDPTGESYTLTNAGFDLDNYQAAGDIYRAINELNRTAAVEAETAKEQLAVSQQKPVDAGLIVPLDASVAPRFLAAVTTIKKLDATVPKNLVRLQTIATALGVPTTPETPAEDLKFFIVVAIDRLVGVKNVDTQKAKITVVEALLK